MQPKIAVLGILRFPAENISAVLPHLQVLVDTTRLKDRCVAYDVAEDPFDPGLVRFSELWPDRESLTKHLSAAHVEQWRVTAKTYGLLDRQFASYDIIGFQPV